jgi:hypothetical protein
MEPKQSVEIGIEAATSLLEYWLRGRERGCGHAMPIMGSKRQTGLEGFQLRVGNYFFCYLATALCG